MKILVDGVFFQYYLTGIARVWWSLLTEWGRTDFGAKLLVADRDGTMPKVGELATVRVPAHSYENLAADREMLQRVCDEQRCDLFVSTYFSHPVRTKSLVMVHDMIPEVFGYASGHEMWLEKRQAIERASAWIAVSENTREDLIRIHPSISRDAVKVARCGVYPAFAPAREEKVKSFLESRRLMKPFYLVVGTRLFEKNAILTFQAFAGSSLQATHDIVCVGGDPKLELEFAELVDCGSVRMLGRISDHELALAYSAAEALVYPSRYEGFGLPILEAMACGCPVITCRVASIPEVTGEAAMYVNPGSVDELARAMEAVRDLTLRQKLKLAGLERAKQFSWAKMANEVRAVLESCASGERVQEAGLF